MKTVTVFKIGFGLDLNIRTFNPLVIDSGEVTVTRVKTDQGEFDGVISTRDHESRIIEKHLGIFLILVHSVLCMELIYTTLTPVKERFYLPFPQPKL